MRYKLEEHSKKSSTAKKLPPGICLTPYLEKIRKGEMTWEDVPKTQSYSQKDSLESLKKRLSGLL